MKRSDQILLEAIRRDGELQTLEHDKRIIRMMVEQIMELQDQLEASKQGVANEHG